MPLPTTGTSTVDAAMILPIACIHFGRAGSCPQVGNCYSASLPARSRPADSRTRNHSVSSMIARPTMS